MSNTDLQLLSRDCMFCVKHLYPSFNCKRLDCFSNCPRRLVAILLVLHLQEQAEKNTKIQH